MPTITIAATDAEITACLPVLLELRPHLTADGFLPQIRRQMAHGFALVSLADPDIVAVAGIRIAEWLASGKCLEIEDLVTSASARSAGHGAALFDWITAHARRAGCTEVKLVSHVRRHDAHRFYLARRMNIIAHHFSLEL